MEGRRRPIERKRSVRGQKLMQMLKKARTVSGSNRGEKPEEG